MCRVGPGHAISRTCKLIGHRPARSFCFSCLERNRSMRAMHKSGLTLAVWLVLVLPAAAQISVPYTFVAGTVANPNEVNANFAQFQNALNRTAGTMIGPLVFSPDNTYDIGAAAGTRPRDIFVARNLTVGGTINLSGITCTACIQESQIIDGTILARV